MSKLYDVKAVIGEYQDSQTGETKKRYADVGVILNGEYGPYMIMNRYFNPAGVPGDNAKGGIILKLFKNEPQQGQQMQDPAAMNPANSPQTMGQPSGAPVFNPNPPQPQGAGVDNGEIPF
jgi:hypothetical protein